MCESTRRILSSALRFALLIAFAGTLHRSITGQTDPVDKGWRGILPLQATKADVEKAFGKPFKVEPEGHLSYRTEEFVIQVNYVPGPCQPNPYNRIKVNAPADTVLDMWIYLNKVIPVAELNFNRAAFKRVVGEDPKDIKYVDRESGVDIGVMVYPDNKEYVVTLTYRPSEKSKTTLGCSP